VELEDRVRQEILHHLKLREGQESSKDLSDINLDDDYTTEMESRFASLHCCLLHPLFDFIRSDGGSDSSVSDGLPMHLQYVSNKVNLILVR
jgi:hypothetical protein